ncbi:Aste57867_768 [Aphanomyces stellatus]|uniref:Aste57867_768 protein n=1 Tax=Aphanomyces stellatus TaxID=120398 RepID=A0A485K3S0_9STRA|nr:hypothetical protein As57867_000767 [Aphanomyces stellatus]VFT77992.1 Aste57867_768 [Aphanomyces stellatus]
MYGTVPTHQDGTAAFDPTRQNLSRTFTFLWLMIGSVSLCSVLLGISFSYTFPRASDAPEDEITQLDAAENPPQENTLGCFPVPSIQVFPCPTITTVSIAQHLVDRGPYPPTTVDLCYTNTTFNLVFSTDHEDTFWVNTSYGHNDNIWEYNVFEAFIALGVNDPVEYFEFEVSPTNQSYSAYILNPHKDFSWPVGHFFVGKNESDARDLGIRVATETDHAAHTWVSHVELGLDLFDVGDDSPQGTQWRMNFMRKITDPTLFPAQNCGAWNAPNVYNFHETPCFGRVKFA